MIIGIDIDNVIGDTFKDLAYYASKFIGKKIEPRKVFELIRRNTLRMLFFYFTAWRIKLITRISPIKGAAETIRKWYPNHKIILITSRSIIFHYQTEEWLRKNNIPYHELHHSKEGQKYKRGKDCDIFIEDNAKECDILADYCKQVFILDYPWNQQISNKTNIFRVKNWEAITAEIG